MKETPDLAERIGTTINELDIDFSRFTVVGWMVSVLSLGTGGGIASFLCRLMIKRNGLDLAAGMTFCFTMIGVTVLSFIGLRWFARQMGFSVIKSDSLAVASENSNRDTLEQMANAGMDMSVSRVIDFWFLFSERNAAERMAREAEQMGNHVASMEPRDGSNSYEVRICIRMLPTLSAISQAEQRLAAVAERFGGRADGWGVKQED